MRKERDDKCVTAKLMNVFVIKAVSDDGYQSSDHSIRSLAGIFTPKTC